MCIPEAICILLPGGMKRITWEAMLSVKKTQGFCRLDIVPSLKPLGVRVSRARDASLHAEGQRPATSISVD